MKCAAFLLIIAIMFLMKNLKQLLYFGIFLTPLVVNPFGFQLYGVVKIAWALMIMGFALSYFFANVLVNGKFEFVYNKKALVFLLLFILSYALSTIFSLNPVQSFFGEYMHMQGLLFYLYIIVHFVICLSLFRDKKVASWFLVFVKWLGFLISVHAILQYFNIDIFSDTDNAEYLFRVYGNVGQPNFLAQLLIFPLFLCSGFLIEAFERRDRKALAVNGLIFLVIFVAIFLTRSRAVLLAIFGSYYLLFLILARVKPLTKVVSTIGLCLAALMVFLVVGFEERSINSRIFLWSSALDIVSLKSSFFGKGLNTFYREFVRVMPKEVFEFEQFFTTPSNVHNETLQAFLERGLVGMGIYVFQIIFLGWLLIKKRLDKQAVSMGFALFAYYISVQFSFSVIEHYIFQAAFWALVLLNVFNWDVVTVKLRSVVWRGLLTLLLAGVAVFTVFASFSIVKADVLMRSGMDKYVFDSELSYEVFDEVASTVKVFAYPHKIVIDLFSPYIDEMSKLSNLQKHLIAYGKITDYDYNFNILAIKSSGAILEGYQIAEYYYHRGISASPNLPLLYVVAGDISYELGDCRRALERYTLLEQLAPSAYLLKNSPVFEESEQYRLFVKHASAFVSAMNRKMECEKNLKGS